MKTIAILNDVHDADYVVQHRAKYSEVTLISTHAAVDDYLEAHELSCIPISSYLKAEEVAKFYEQADCVNDLLHELDKEFGNKLNETLGFKVPLRFFYALYRYRGRYEYTNLLKEKTAFERILKQTQPQKVILFQPRNVQDSSSFFSTRISIIELMLMCLNVDVHKISTPVSENIRLKEKRMRQKTKLDKVFSFTFSNFFQRIRKFVIRKNSGVDSIFIKINDTSGSIILINGMLSGELLPTQFENLVPFAINLHNRLPTQEKTPPPNLIEARDEARRSLSNTEIDIVYIFKAIVLEDFCHKFIEYLTPALNLQSLAKKEKILGGIWSSPPCMPDSKSLINEFLLSLGTLVIGRQHGGNYGIEVSQPKHFDSDFWWCTHYLSYGFSKEDLAETSPALQARCEIIPVGENVTVQPVSDKHQKIDILFPISNAVPFYKEPVRTLLHQLSEYQRELLKFLNQLSGVRVVVKPFPGYSYATSAFMELLPTLKNLEVINMPFTKVLENYEVGAIVSEFPSSPLFECLKTDAEILSLTNPLLPFNSTAELLLKKRVYFYDSLPEIKQGITDFLQSRLPRRRNSEFAEKYLLPANPQGVKKITAEIFGIS